MAMILVVEDEDHVQAVLADILRTVNHKVRAAPTAAAGIDMFRNEKPDAVLLDVKLPDGSGIDVLDEMRQLRADVPVIMMSGHADEVLIQETLKRGAFDFIAKPFNLDQLVRVVAAALTA